MEISTIIIVIVFSSITFGIMYYLLEEYKKENNKKIDETKKDTTNKIDESKKETTNKIDESKKETTNKIDATNIKTKELDDKFDATVTTLNDVYSKINQDNQDTFIKIQNENQDSATIIADKFNTLKTDVTNLTQQKFAEIKQITDDINSNPLLMKDFAKFDTETKKFTVGSSDIVAEIDITKPINITEPININNAINIHKDKSMQIGDGWTIKSELAVNNTGKSKLCFKKGDRKVLCINDGDNPLELFQTNGTLQFTLPGAVASDKEYFIRGPE